MDIYTNKSSTAKIKSVTMYDRNGIKIKSFQSIAEAAREISNSEDNFDSLCASISSVCNDKGSFVKSKYRFDSFKPSNKSKNYC